MGTMAIYPAAKSSNPKANNIIAFRDWKLQQLMKTFQLVRTNNCNLLDEWLQMPHPASDEEKAFLEKLRQNWKSILFIGMK